MKTAVGIIVGWLTAMPAFYYLSQTINGWGALGVLLLLLMGDRLAGKLIG